MSSAPGGTGSSSGCEGFSDVIDFRYHLVSIIAIFFALATGIIPALAPRQCDERLSTRFPTARREQQLRDQIVALRRTRFEEVVDSAHAARRRAAAIAGLLRRASRRRR